MGKNLKIALLMDFYGSMLTDKQRDIMEMYYYDDLSLAEIAEHENITRQGVHDSIRRGEVLLFELDRKLGLADKLIKCKEVFENINKLAQNVYDESISRYPKNITKNSSRIIECTKFAEEILNQ